MNKLMLAAASNSDLATLTVLRNDCGIDVHAVSQKSGNTIAHVAALKGYHRIFAELHRLEVDLQSSNAAGDSPAVVAARNGDGSCLRALRYCGIGVMRPSSSSVTPFQVAQSQIRSDIVRLLKTVLSEEDAGDASAKNAELSLMADLNADEMRSKT